jgi:hypothetical protein
LEVDASGDSKEVELKWNHIVLLHSFWRGEEFLRKRV